MKKMLVITLAVTLLLSGCATTDDPEQTTTVPTVTEETVPGMYVPESALEKQTGGAVWQYALPESSYSRICAVGDALVLMGSGSESELTLLSGETCVPAGNVTMEADAEKTVLRSGSRGIAYYAEKTNEVVFLDTQLRQTDRISLPEDIQGTPVFSSDREEIFYCVGQEIRSIETQRGISRMIKSHTCVSQTLLGCYFDGRLLACRATYEDGTQKTLYISSEKGETLFTYDGITELYTYEDAFFALGKDGIVDQILFGTEDGTPQQLNVTGGKMLPALELNGAVQYSQQETGETAFSFYDLSTGLKTAAVTVSGLDEVKTVLADRWSGCLWILASQKEKGDTLLRWNPKASSVTDETVYTGPFYNALTPDEEGIAACKDRAETLNRTHGVKIRLWESAVKYPGDYVLEAEHQPQALNQCLDELTPVLEEFPKKFLKTVISNQLRVCIVRSVNGEQKCAWYWNGSSFYIILSVGSDIREGFITGVSYAVDSHILGNSSRYDYWKPLNPDGFNYADTSTHLDEYLEGDTRAFVDEVSMTSVTEDRSRVFYQAMQPNNEEMFQSKIMQEKLHLMCKAIRSAWSWKKKTEIFLWEQYLEEPIAYNK